MAVLQVDPNPEDIAIVRQHLDDHNLLFAYDNNYKKLAMVLRDDDDVVIGGILGGTNSGYLYIDVLWVGEDHGKHGVRLLNEAEAEAVKSGCKYAHSDTHSLEVLSFFQENGYDVVGELEDIPPGYTRYMLRKVL